MTTVANQNWPQYDPAKKVNQKKFQLTQVSRGHSLTTILRNNPDWPIQVNPWFPEDRKQMKPTPTFQNTPFIIFKRILYWATYEGIITAIYEIYI